MLQCSGVLGSFVTFSVVFQSYCMVSYGLVHEKGKKKHY